MTSLRPAGHRDGYTQGLWKCASPLGVGRSMWGGNLRHRNWRPCPLSCSSREGESLDRNASEEWCGERAPPAPPPVETPPTRVLIRDSRAWHSFLPEAPSGPAGPQHSSHLHPLPCQSSQTKPVSCLRIMDRKWALASCLSSSGALYLSL